MTWNYCIIKRKNKDGKSFRYVIGEFFDMSDDGIDEKNMWTEEDISPLGETPEELIETLELMLKDIKSFPIIDEEKYT